jgi:hypothetical protein
MILCSDVLPIDEREMSAAEAWEIYGELAEFENVSFDRFSARLKAHRIQVGKRQVSALNEELALHHDKQVNPSKLVNERGELVFSQDWRNMKQLRKDVKKGRHLRMTPSQLQARRKVYHPYKKTHIQRAYIPRSVTAKILRVLGVETGENICQNFRGQLRFELG